MAKKIKETTLAVRNQVVALLNENKSVRYISKSLKIPKSTVGDIIKKYKTYGNVDNKIGRGRKNFLSQRDVNFIQRQVKVDPFISAQKLANMLQQSSGKVMCAKTISNQLRALNYRSRVPRKKPFISKQNQKKRLAYAQKYKDMPMSFWKKNLWTDESKFNLKGSDGRKRVWRLPGEGLKIRNLRGTVKHGGGSVMVWGCMSYKGVGKIEFIEGIMRKEEYKSILERNIIPSVQKLRIKSNFVFMQDNDPKHKSSFVMDYLKKMVPSILDHPPQSPDLNVIEHLWDEVGRRLSKLPITNKKMLREEIIKIWNSLGPNETEKLVQSMPNRLKEVIKNKGGPTCY